MARKARAVRSNRAAADDLLSPVTEESIGEEAAIAAQAIRRQDIEQFDRKLTDPEAARFMALVGTQLLLDAADLDPKKSKFVSPPSAQARAALQPDYRLIAANLYNVVVDLTLAAESARGAFGAEGDHETVRASIDRRLGDTVGRGQETLRAYAPAFGLDPKSYPWEG